MKKLNDKKLIYIAAILYSTYFTYLFSRIWFIGKKGILAIYITSLILAVIFTKFILKKCKISILKKKTFMLLFLISIFITSISKFLVCSYVPTEITVYTKDNNIINSIMFNNRVYNYGNGSFNDSKTEDKSINKRIKIIKKENYIIINLDKCYKSHILFNKKNDEYKIKESNRVKTIKRDRYGNLFYYITSNSKYDGVSIIRFILSTSMIFYVLVMLLTLFKNLNKEEKWFYVTTVLTFIIGLFYIVNTQSAGLFNDSVEYINYDFDRLFSLKLNGRVPIYSIIISLCKFLFNFEYLNFLVIIQYICWFVSLLYLYKIIITLTNNNKLSFLAAIIYAISPAIMGWNASILTESFALSGTVVFIYYIIKYIKTERILYATISIILSLFLTFLRPTSIIFLFGLLVFFIMRLILEKNHKQDIKCLLIEGAALIIIVIYACLFHNEYGIYSISDAVVRQDLMVSIKEGYYKDGEDKEILEYINERIPNNKADNKYLWPAIYEAPKHFTLDRIKKFTSTARRKNSKEYINYLVYLIESNGSTNFYGYTFSSTSKHFGWLSVALRSSFTFMTFFHVYLIIAIEFALFIIKWIKDKKVPWIYLGLFSFPFIIILSTFIGTNGEFMRTASCSVPFCYLIIVMLFYDFLLKKHNV